MQGPHLALSVGLLLGLPDSLAAEPAPERLAALFQESCLAAERPELRASATGSWIEALCAQDARARAQAFAGLDRTGRLRELGRDCERWHEVNRWRLPAHLQEDAEAGAAYVQAACAAEALERLRALETQAPGAGP
jgi:hypothetical protein